VIENRFETREQASLHVAERMSTALDRQIVERDCAYMVVSGGTTPAACFSRLASASIDWARVRLFLSDERWVSAQHADSNERLVNDSLRGAAAKAASLYRVYSEVTPIDRRCEEIEQDLRQLPFPFTCVLLGMGVDGHFASLFPDDDEYPSGLEPDGAQLCKPVHTTASTHPRVSLTLSALCRSEEILLLIFGEEKWRTFENAKRTHDLYPVSSLLSQTRTPVHVFWAP
jgi:6-phosphogluconolactonase